MAKVVVVFAYDTRFVGYEIVMALQEAGHEAISFNEYWWKEIAPDATVVAGLKMVAENHDKIVIVVSKQLLADPVKSRVWEYAPDKVVVVCLIRGLKLPPGLAEVSQIWLPSNIELPDFDAGLATLFAAL